MSVLNEEVLKDLELAREQLTNSDCSIAVMEFTAVSKIMIVKTKKEKLKFLFLGK